MKFKSFTLDPFQEKAVNALLDGHSVVVSAATGTGKTLIADFMIEHAIKNSEKVFYTAPIKALSNQKYRDFCESYGNEKVGLLTGDTVINPEGQIIVMTTEIYRNMLHEGSDTLQNLKYVVYDEVHFISDRERGTVWEESIIFSPDQVRFICLSATIPNFKQFAQWIESIAGHKVETVSYTKRAVPLHHLVMDTELGLSTIDEVAKAHNKVKDIDNYYDLPGRRKRGNRHQRGGQRRKRSSFKVPQQVDLVDELAENGWLPGIVFSFSRKQTLQNAVTLARKRDFTTPEQKAHIIKKMREFITPEISQMPSVQAIRDVLPKGIGVHNAGVLPQIKHLVETLFNEGYLSVLYATETFAVGINMPAKAVCFTGFRKFDGLSFRNLNSKEYFQLAGRAGRRGIDKVGRSIVIIDRNNDDLEKIKLVTDKDSEPMVSQFKLSYNTVLNLLQNYENEETIETILKSNFGYFVRRQSAQQYRITTSYKNYKRTLTKLGYVKDDRLTEKGMFATHIYTNELVMSELVLSGALNKLSIADIATLIAALQYEARRADYFEIKRVDVNDLLKLVDDNNTVRRAIKKLHVKKMRSIVQPWVEGQDFDELLNICNLAEGDIIRLFRQLLDTLRQIKSGLKATNMNPELLDQINNCIHAIDRDVVSNVL